MPLVRWVMRQLLDPGQSMWTYILRAWLISITGSLLLGLLALFISSSVGYSSDFSLGEDRLSPLVFVVFFAALTPAIETALMFPIVWLAGLFTRDMVSIALVSAVIWGGLHTAINDITNGIPATWGFFVLTIALQVGRLASWWQAYLVPFLIHAMTNSVAATLLLIPDSQA